MKVVKLVVSFSLVTAMTVRAALACFPCSQAVDQEELADFCPASQGLRDSLLACSRRDESDPASGCANECAAWLLATDYCASSGDPFCAPADLNHDGVYDPAGADNATDCYNCMAGYPVPPYAGIGCGAENEACSADTTGCINCAAYLGGQVEDLICYSPVNGATAQSWPDALSLSDCACNGACAARCASMCRVTLGVKWWDSRLTMTGPCAGCLSRANGCMTQGEACAAN